MRFIVISVPPEPVAQAIRNLQETLSGRTGSREALRYPPHVTLRTGIVCPDVNAKDTALAFLEYAARLKAVDIVCTGPVASAYRDEGGIERGFLGYEVQLSDDLKKFHSELLAFTLWQKGPQSEYFPHVSLCYRDISPGLALELLEEFGQELESLRPAWRADEVAVELWESAGESWKFYAKASLR